MFILGCSTNNSSTDVYQEVYASDGAVSSWDDGYNEGFAEGYAEGYSQHRRDAFSDPDEAADTIYTFFEKYCDDDDFARFVDSNYEEWLKYIPSDRALR